MLRADLELGRGQFEAARSHLDAALTTLREDRGLGVYDELRAELAYWERRFTDADQAVRDALAMARSGQTASLRVRFCAKGLRAQADLAALARARRDADAERTWRAAARRLVAGARRAAAHSVKTANVHVSHILGKLGTPNRREAAAIAHRLTPPPVGL
jgi:hypothetical protein